MPRTFTHEEADRHNALTQRGWDMIENELFLLGNSISGTPGWFARRKLKKASRCFEQALAINPEGWSSMWALGKIHQRLGDHGKSLEWFARAHEINPTQPDVAREAGLAALDCGEASLALQFCLAAVENNSGDPGLVCNLALAHMLAGDDSEAIRCATSAVDRAPEDDISKVALRLIQDVASGKRARPRTLQEMIPN